MANTGRHATQNQEKRQQVGGEAAGGAGTWQVWPSQARAGRARGTGSQVSFKPGRRLVFLLCVFLVPSPAPAPPSAAAEPLSRRPSGGQRPAPPPRRGGGPAAPAWAQSGSSSPRPSPGSSFPSSLSPPFSSPLLLRPLSALRLPAPWARPPEDAGALAGDPSPALTFSRFAVRGAGRTSPPRPLAATSCPPAGAAGSPEPGPCSRAPHSSARRAQPRQASSPRTLDRLGGPPKPPLRATRWQKVKCNKASSPVPLASGYRNTATGLRLFRGPSGEVGARPRDGLEGGL